MCYTYNIYNSVLIILYFNIYMIKNRFIISTNIYIFYEIHPLICYNPQKIIQISSKTNNYIK